MGFHTALRAGTCWHLFFHRPGELYREDSGRDGDDAVARDHHYRRQGLAQAGSGGDVSVPDGSQGDDGPVDAFGDAGETVFLSLDNVHQRAEDYHQGQQDQEENGDLPETGPQSLKEDIHLRNESGQLEDPEDPENPKKPDDKEGLSPGEEEAQGSGNNSQEVYYPVETGGVFEGSIGRVEPETVLHGKYDGEEPLRPVDNSSPRFLNRPDTIQHHYQYAQQDADDQDYIEGFTGRSICLEDNLPQAGPKVFRP